MACNAYQESAGSYSFFISHHRLKRRQHADQIGLAFGSRLRKDRPELRAHGANSYSRTLRGFCDHYHELLSIVRDAMIPNPDKKK